jgi:glycosyltransferase involved in cell wall biosynthesis
MSELISVIIPAFNRASFLKKAVESVLSQTYQNFELIIVDDGSDDDTKKILSPYTDRITYLFQENRGPASARNSGIKISKGNFLAFLDSDDVWVKEKLAVQMSQMRTNPSYLISHTQEIWYKNKKILKQKKKHKKFHGHIFNKCLPLCAVSLSTVIIREELFKAIGLFDETMPCCEDYDFWLRVSIKYPFLLIDRPLTIKDGGRPDQVSAIYARGMDKFRIKSILKILEAPHRLSPEQKTLALKKLKKKCRIYGNGCIKHGKAEEGKYYLELPENLNKSFDFAQDGEPVEPQ